MSRGKRRSLIPHSFQDLKIWPEPDIHVLKGDVGAVYARRKEAIEMYAADESYSDISTRTGLCEQEVRRIVKRCVSPRGDGNIFGFYALVLGSRIRPYSRQKEIVRVPGSGSAGCAGALDQLLARLPEIAWFLEQMLFKEDNRQVVHEARVPYAAIHKAFLKRLRENGFTDSDWPFNTENRGYNAIRNYCNQLRDRHSDRWIRSRVGPDAARRSSVGSGHVPLIPVFRPFSHVQLDFHKVDAASIIVLRNEHGVDLDVPLSRWHIGLLTDERSHAILGICHALELNPSGDSVLETIESALRPESFSNSAENCAVLVDGRVLPNQLFPSLAYQGFTVIKMDNAWCNAATEVVHNVIDTIGCAVNFGPVRAWWIRPLIERIFGELTRKGLQRLPSTYGSSPSDTRRGNPNALAIQFRIMLSELQEIILKCVRQYNEANSEGLQFASPIQVLQAALNHPSSGFLPQPLPLPVQRDLRLFRHIEECTVRGNLKKNVRPHIRIDRCRYTNSYLARSYHLLGNKVVVYMDRRDVRIASATIKETGEEIGTLIPERRWRMHAVPIRFRKLINRSGFAKRLMNESDDPVADWSREKKRSLVAQRKAKKQLYKSSRDALELAKASGTLRKLSSMDQPRPAEIPATPRSPDPFGISEIPTVLSARRRT